jgi:hypothetical protein
MATVTVQISEANWSKYSIPIDIWNESGNRLYPAWTLVRDTHFLADGGNNTVSSMRLSTDEKVYIKSGNTFLPRNLFVKIALTGTGAATKNWTTDNKRYYMETSYGKDSTSWGYWVQWDPNAPQGTGPSGKLRTIEFQLLGNAAQAKAKAAEAASNAALAAAYKKWPAAANRGGNQGAPPATNPGTSNPSPQAGAAGTESSRTAGRSNAPAQNNNRGTTSPVQPETLQKITRVETTNNFGIAAKDFAVTPDTPYILQTYVLADQINPNNYSNIRKIFTIDIVPNSFEFSQLASVWNEIDRPGNFSLTDWGKYNLLKVNFKFVISATIKEGPLDGMKNSIETQLDLIRKIAQAPHPIRLINCTPYLSKSWKFPFTKTGEEIQFVISDLSVNTTRFTPGGVHEASVAEVTISLTEYSNPNMGTLAVLPPLKKASTKPGKPGTGNTTNQYTKTTDYLSGSLLPTVGTDSTTPS